MTSEQEEHLRTIKEFCVGMLDLKYRAGAAEHGGVLADLTPLALVTHAIEENIDSLAYLITARDRLLAEQRRTDRDE